VLPAAEDGGGDVLAAAGSQSGQERGRRHDAG
jgi:hypothetical protein